MIQHLILLKVLNMTDINLDLLQWLFKSEEIAGTFYKKERQNTNHKEFRAENVIKS